MAAVAFVHSLSLAFFLVLFSSLFMPFPFFSRVVSLHASSTSFSLAFLAVFFVSHTILSVPLAPSLYIDTHAPHSHAPLVLFSAPFWLIVLVVFSSPSHEPAAPAQPHQEHFLPAAEKRGAEGAQGLSARAIQVLPAAPFYHQGASELRGVGAVAPPLASGTCFCGFFLLRSVVQRPVPPPPHLQDLLLSLGSASDPITSPRLRCRFLFLGSSGRERPLVDTSLFAPISLLSHLLALPLQLRKSY